MQIYYFQLFADFFQFELRDSCASSDISLLWTESTVNNLLVVAPDSIGVGTVRDSYVKVELIVQHNPPIDESVKWDQIAECDVELNSGQITIIDGETYLPEAIRIDVEPGRYRARIYYGNLGSVRSGDRKGDDNYKIVLWPTLSIGSLEFIKRWRPEYSS